MIFSLSLYIYIYTYIYIYHHYHHQAVLMAWSLLTLTLRLYRPYLSNIAFIENDVNDVMGKARVAIDRQLTI